MSNNWFDKNMKMLALDGGHGGVSDSRKIHAKHYYELRFQDNPLLNNVIIGNVDYDVIEVDDQKDSNLKTIYFRPDIEILEGVYVTLEDNIWLLLDYIKNAEMFPKALIQLCTFNLEWSDEDNDYSYPCAPFNKISRYQEVEWRNRTVMLPDNVFEIRIQANEDTQKIKLRQRFIINNKAWEVEALDGVSDIKPGGNGILYIIVKQSQLKYDDLPEDEEEYPDDYLVVIEGSSDIAVNRQAQYIANVYNNGIIIPDANITWEVDGLGSIDVNGLFISGSVKGNTNIIAKYDNGIEIVESSKPVKIGVLW